MRWQILVKGALIIAQGAGKMMACGQRNGQQSTSERINTFNTSLATALLKSVKIAMVTTWVVHQHVPLAVPIR
jgi:hypothetical protein